MPELGSLSLYGVVMLSLYAAVMCAAGAIKGRETWIRSGERAGHAVFGLLVLAFVLLEWALVTDRFDIEFVAKISAVEQPLLFKLAIWGGQEGSLLLWAFMLGAMASLVVYQNRQRNRDLMPWVTVCMMGNLLFFGGIVALTSNPFQALPAAHVLSNGQGMNPLLQHPVMLIHPIVLYLGFVGFSVPFSFALAALITGRLGTGWFTPTRRWTLVAWFFLGCGIMLGGRWAYEVLGWGGYWAWDPVENASLMPWLVGTAYLHSVIIQEKRGMLKVWNLALIGMTYSLCIFGTFLTRSGVVQSVHSFANAGWFGTLFLVYVVVVAAVFAGFLIHRLPELKSRSKLESVVSREGSFLLNNYAFMGLTAIVLWGTMAPVWVAYFSKGEQIMRGPTWFQTYAGPLAIGLLILTGIGPLIAWRRATWVNLRKSFRLPILAAAIAAPSAWLLGYQSFYAVVFMALCAFVTGTIALEYWRGMRVRMRRGESALRSFLELLSRNQRRYGGYVVHLSVVLMFIGFAGSVFDLEQTKRMKPGERWSLAGYTIENRGALPVVHPHYAGAQVRLALYKGEDPVGILTPEKRIYFQQEQPATFPAVSSTFGEDFYVILNGLEADQTAALKVYVNPLVNWIWLGGLVFVIGNTLLLWRIPPAGVSSAND